MSLSNDKECIVCGKAATRLCDAHIGGEIAGYVRDGSLSDNQFRAFVNVDSEMYTCDAPLCAEHAQQIGVTFVCAKSRVNSAIETVDVCPGDHPDWKPMTLEESQYLRRKIHADVRRKSICGHPPGAESVHNPN